MLTRNCEFISHNYDFIKICLIKSYNSKKKSLNSETWNCEEKSQNSEKIDLIFMPQSKQAFRLTLEEENCAGMFTYFFPSLNFDIKIASQF